MIRFADVTPDAKPKKAAAPPEREPVVLAPEAKAESATPKPGKTPRKKKSA